MKETLRYLGLNLRRYPFSIISLGIICWFWYLEFSSYYAYKAYVKSQNETMNCINGFAYGFILAGLLTIIYIIVSLIQIYFRRDKVFYVRLSCLCIFAFGSLLFYMTS